MKRIYNLLVLVLLLIIILSSCTSGTKVQNSNLPTQPAVRFLNLTSLNYSSPTILPPTPVPTFTPKPTSTQVPTQKVSLKETLTPTLPACVDKAEIIRHLSVAPNTMFHPGDNFAKVWLIKNSGTCTWTTEYYFVFIGGDLLEASQQEFPLSQIVLPGQTVEIRVSMTAPQVPSTYTSNWMLRDSAGNFVGVGDLGDQPFQVIIYVPSIIRLTPT